MKKKYKVLSYFMVSLSFSFLVIILKKNPLKDIFDYFLIGIISASFMWNLLMMIQGMIQEQSYRFYIYLSELEKMRQGLPFHLAKVYEDE